MNNSFIEKLLFEGQKKASESQLIKMATLGPKTILVRVNTDSYLNKLILGSLIPSDRDDFDFILDVRISTNFDLILKTLHSLFPSEQLNIPMRYERTYPYRLFLCENQSQIYLYDSLNKRGLIILRPSHYLDLRSYITPFRLMFSWMSLHFEGEVVHASSITLNGRSLLINGEKGSGKSTLSLLAIEKGFQIISDDAVIVAQSSVFALYSRAKIETDNVFTAHMLQNSFPLRGLRDAKHILPLGTYREQFCLKSKLHSIILPVRSDSSKLQSLSLKESIPSFVPNSLREIFEGTFVNKIRHVDILRHFPRYRLYASSQMSENLELLRGILVEEK